MTPERLKLLVGVLKATQPGSIPFCPHKPTPKQQQFIDLTCLEAMYGGAAGGGKSDCLLMCALQHVNDPNYAALIVRRSYSDLSLPGAIMDRAKDWLRPAIPWNEKDKTFRFPSGATLTFGFLENDKDKYRYQGSEIQFLGVDEVTQFPEQSYRYLLSRLRRVEGSKVPIRARSASNPGGIGTAWVKRRFVDEGAPAAFIPSLLSENPYIDQVEYRKSLAALDPVTRRQLEEGIWVQDSGGLVYPHYDKDRNSWPKDAPKLETYMLGIDYGFVDECAFTVVGWRTYDPNIYIVSSEKIGKMTPSKAGEHAKMLEEHFHFTKIVGDVGGLGKGYAEEARKRFSLPIEAAQKHNKRGYIDLFNGDMARGRIKVHPSCEALIKEWAELPWDERHQSELDGFDNHLADSCLYVWRATTAFHNGPPADPPTPEQAIRNSTDAFWERVSDENTGKSGREWWNDDKW